MKKYNCFVLLIVIMISTVAAFAVDVRWTSRIAISPVAPTTGVPASAEASFRVEGAGGIDNLRVIGGIVGGDVMFDRTWAHIEDGATRRANFSGTPPEPGTFVVYFQIDPEGASPDSDRTNNRIELSFTITPGLMANLAFMMGPVLTPAIFTSGDTLDIHYAVYNSGDAASRDFLVGLRVDGMMIAQNSHTAIAPGTRSIEGRFAWPVVCGARVELVLDSGNDVPESDETDNILTSTRMSECAAAPVWPNLTVEKLKIDSGESVVPEKAALYYRGKVWSRDNSTNNVKIRAGIVGGAVLYEKVVVSMPKDAPVKVEFKATLPKGIQTLYLEVDPDDTIEESFEHDNRVTSRFQVVGKEGPLYVPSKQTSSTVPKN